MTSPPPPVPPPLPPAGSQPAVTPPRRPSTLRRRAVAERGSRRGILVAVLALIVVLGGLGSYVVWRVTRRMAVERTRPPALPDVAQQFLHALTVADGIDPDAPQPAMAGYAHAWSLLDAAAREARPFDVFVEEWMRTFDRFGPIVEVSPPQGQRVMGGWRAVAIVRLGGDRQAAGGFTTVLVTLNLARSYEAAAGWCVTSFSWVPSELATGR